MLKLTNSSNRPIFVNISDIAFVSEQSSFIADTNTHYTKITFTHGSEVYVTEPAEEIVRYIVNKKSYSSNTQYDTLTNRVIHQDDNDFDTLIEALDYAQIHLRAKIKEHQEKDTGLYQQKIYEDFLKEFERLSQSLVSVTVREMK